MKKRAPINSQIVGTQTKPYHYKATYRDISNYSASIFDENSAYYHEGKGNEIIAHPLFPVRISWQIVERLHTLWDVTFPVNLLDHLIHQSEYIKIFRPLKEEEYLAILDAGAYGFTMSSPYNSRPRTAEILINNGETYKIREAETYDDILKHQIIPEHLK